MSTPILVWSGGDTLTLPQRFVGRDLPRSDQDQGSWAARLAEVAARVCYDPYGPSGRSSAALHEHLKAVHHGTPYEHVPLPLIVEVPEGLTIWPLLAALANAPDVWVRPTSELAAIVVINARHLVDPNGLAMTEDVPEAFVTPLAWFRYHVLQIVAPLLPEVLDADPAGLPDSEGWSRMLVTLSQPHVSPGAFDEECWATVGVVLGRTAIHTLARHGVWTALSERSPRFPSAWTWPPVPRYIEAFLADTAAEFAEARDLVERILARACAHVPIEVTNTIQPILTSWLSAEGMTPAAAVGMAREEVRKLQPQGATADIVFSASIRQWKNLMRLYGGGAANPDVRAFFTDCLTLLKASNYSTRFDGFSFGDGPLGVGATIGEA